MSSTVAKFQPAFIEVNNYSYFCLNIASENTFTGYSILDFKIISKEFDLLPKHYAQQPEAEIHCKLVPRAQGTFLAPFRIQI